MKEWGKVPKDKGEFIEDKFVIHQAAVNGSPQSAMHLLDNPCKMLLPSSMKILHQYLKAENPRN